MSGNNSNELGYPHEIIISALQKAHETKKANDVGSKTIAYGELIIYLNDGKPTSPSSAMGDEIETKVLSSIVNKTRFTQKEKNDLVEYLNKSINDYKERKTQSSYEELLDIYSKSLMLDFIFQNTKRANLIDRKTFDNISSLGLETLVDTRLSNIQQIVLTYQREELDDALVTNTIARLNACPDLFLSLTYSLQYALKFPSFKPNFLQCHYLTLKKMMDKEKGAIENKSLDEESLIDLFKFAALLKLLGYDKSLRLSHIEKINYLDTILKNPASASEFEKYYDSEASLNIRFIKIPLWALMLLVTGLILASMLNEVYVSSSIGSGIGFDLPFPVPLFLTSALIVALICVAQMKGLKHRISQKMRGN